MKHGANIHILLFIWQLELDGLLNMENANLSRLGPRSPITSLEAWLGPDIAMHQNEVLNFCCLILDSCYFRVQ